jgi:5-methylcytosine-specific restriction protein A
MPILKKNRTSRPRHRETDKKNNANHKAVYNTNTWRLLRLQYLSNNPLCGRCLAKGKYISAIECHHIVPISTGKSLAEKQQIGFNPNNLEGLCEECHREHHKNNFYKKL